MIGAVGGTFGVVGGTLVGAEPLEPEPEAVVIAQDAYDRTIAETSATTGFGTADIGGAYGTSGNVASVANGEGRLRLPSANSAATARLRQAISADFDVMFHLGLTVLPNGSGVMIIPRARIGASVDDDYRLKVRVLGTGAVHLGLARAAAGVETELLPDTSTGVVMSVTDTLRVRFHVIGSNPTQLRGKVWLNGQPEPAAWFIDTTDSWAGGQGRTGHLALSNILSSSTTNGPVTVRVLDLLATDGGAAPADTVAATVTETV